MKQKTWRVDPLGRRVYRRIHLGIPYDFTRITNQLGITVYRVHKWDAQSMSWFYVGPTMSITNYLRGL
jgi:hypothetical protein